MCCMGMSKECLACKKGVSVAEFCKDLANMEYCASGSASGSGSPAKPTRGGKYCADRCPHPRVRKDYAHLTTDERELYKEAMNAMYKSGVYYTFVKIHENGVNDPF